MSSEGPSAGARQPPDHGRNRPANLDATAGQAWPESALQAYLAAASGAPFAPGALHHGGRGAAHLLGAARAVVAEDLGCRADDVWFCSSGAEAARLAVAGAASFGAAGVAGAGPASVLSPGTERMEVLAPAREMGLTELPVDSTGRVDIAALEAELRSHPGAPVALQQGNPEVGTLQPIDQAAELCRAHGSELVMDAAASLGYVPIQPGWTVLLADGRGFGAPPIGVLAVRLGARWDWPGGRPPAVPGCAPGFSDVPSAVALATALRARAGEQPAESGRLRALTDRLRSELPRRIPDLVVHGDPDARLPQVVTFSCLYLDAEAVTGELDRRDLWVGSGSACAAEAGQPSHVLAAMGALTHGNVRVALPFGCPEGDVERLLEVLPGVVDRLRTEAGVQDL